MISWTLQETPIKYLKDNPKNPRKIDKAQMDRLSTIIDKFGLIDKPILNADYTIIGGHQRIKILKKKRNSTIECWIPNRQLNDKELDELCIGLNLHQGKWDWEILASEWQPDDLLNLGFSEELLMQHFQEKEDIFPEEKKEKTKKKKVCPSCGCEF